MKLPRFFVSMSSSSVYQTVHPYRLIYTLAGMHYHEPPKPVPNYEPRVTFPWLLNYIRLVFMELSGTAMYLYVSTNLDVRGSFILESGIKVCQGLSGITVMIASLIFNFNYLSFVEVLRKLHSVDEMFTSLEIRNDHTRQHKSIWQAIVVTVGVHLIMHILSAFLYFGNNMPSEQKFYILIMLIFTVFSFHIPFTIALGNYLIYTYLIHERYELLNELIKTRFDTSNRRRMIWVKELMPPMKNQQELIQQISEIHATLSDMVDILSNSQWVSFICLSVNTLAYTTFNIYSLYRMMLLQVEWQRVSTTLPTLLWNVIYVGMYAAVIVRGIFVGWIADGTVTLLYKVVNNERDPKMEMALRNAAWQIRGRSSELKFKFYNSSFPVLFSTVGLIITYLVILFQFDSMMKQ
uniref:gustatory receptor 29 n=1 Tax=Aedes aegypti TaxID=7159 RepID=UPI000C23E225|nr:gustatory receptor 29 [Aedes aegypti]